MRRGLQRILDCKALAQYEIKNVQRIKAANGFCIAGSWPPSSVGDKKAFDYLNMIL